VTKRIYTGRKVKELFNSSMNRNIKRIVKYNGIGGYTKMKLEDIYEGEYYTIRRSTPNTWVIEMVGIVG
jgi:hypothetical protein